MKTQKTKIIAESIIYTLLTFYFLLSHFNLLAQSGGAAINISGSAADNSAMLDVSSTTQGVLISRMTTAQRDLISSPAAGLFIYNTDCNNFNYNAGTPLAPNWIPLNTSGGSLPATPGTITGSLSVCPNATGISYSITAVPGATSYIWTVPIGASIASGQGTTSANVNFGTTAGNICVAASNNCGTSSTNCNALTFNIASVPFANAGSGASTTQITANWNASSNATGYYLDVATDISFTGILTNYNNFNANNVLTYNVTGLSCGNTYYYRVRAYNTCGTSGSSNTITYSTSTCCSDAWTQKADFGGASGTARMAAAGFSIGTKGYIGTGNDGVFKKDFWEWDQSTNTWSQKADFGGCARYLAVGFSIGTKGYIGTGYDGSSYLKDFWEYDQAGNSWTQKADFGGTARFFAVGFSIGTKGYIGTGRQGCGSDFGDFWEYDQTAGTWMQKANFGGGGRFGAVGFSINTKGYIGVGNQGCGSMKNDLWEYTWGAGSMGGSWVSKASFGGSARYGSVGFSIGSKGYIGSGCCFSTDFWAYDQTGDSWTQKASFGGPGPEGRYMTLGFSIGTKGYVGTGGATSGNLKDLWEYCP